MRRKQGAGRGVPAWRGENLGLMRVIIAAVFVARNPDAFGSSDEVGSHREGEPLASHYQRPAQQELRPPRWPRRLDRATDPRRAVMASATNQSQVFTRLCIQSQEHPKGPGIWLRFRY
jgi:hypothetical protein